MANSQNTSDGREIVVDFLNKYGRFTSTLGVVVSAFVNFVYKEIIYQKIYGEAFNGSPGAYVQLAVPFIVLAFPAHLIVRWYLHSRWIKRIKVTGLHDVRIDNAKSAQNSFWPENLVKDSSISKLDVLGHGCSKWTAESDRKTMLESFGRLAQNEVRIRFLTCCPMFLEKLGHTKKAGKNATSILELKQLLDAGIKNKKFEMRVYKRLPPMRLIIKDGICVVGHYQLNAMGDSLQSPLMHFVKSGEKIEGDWKFNSIFESYFAAEWESAKKNTVDYVEYEKIKRKYPVEASV